MEVMCYVPKDTLPEHPLRVHVEFPRSYVCFHIQQNWPAVTRRFVFQTEISGKYVEVVLISLLLYFFSSLRHRDQSTVFCILCSASVY